MRIFYASGSKPNGALAVSEIWRSNLYGALVDLGHEVIEFDYDLEPLIEASDTSNAQSRRYVMRYRPEACKELIRQITLAHAEAPVDLFFSYFSSSCTTPEAIRAVRALGVRTLNWYCNASYQFHLVEEIAPAYDACLVPERYRLDDYRRIGANPIYCQEAANPACYRPLPLPRDLDVVFVGARYGDRPELIRRLLDAGLDVRVFGPGWVPESLSKRAGRLTPRRVVGRARRAVLRRNSSAAAAPAVPMSACGGVIADEELPVVYSRAKIVVGFSAVGSTGTSGERLTQVRLRDFEATMSGAFYLVEHVDELAEFYEIGREIVTYRDPDELVERCLYYLANEEAREQIRIAGHARALRDHTWQRRFTDVFREMGLAT